MRKITGHTKLYCLLGHPAAHSISPAMHNAAFEAQGHDGVYLAFDIEPDEFTQAIEGLKAIHLSGMNLTMPYKRDIIPFLDELLPTARLCQAVNTVIVRDGRWIGTSTDGQGYLDSLSAMGIQPQDHSITILGAGGAASAIIAQAAIDGVREIRIGKRRNNTYDEALHFAKQVSDLTHASVTVFPMDEEDALRDAVHEASLLINATNVGMEEDLRTPVPASMLRKDLIVTDIIYHPEETTLLREAKALGCTTMNGKYMLLYQGAASYEMWTGQKMPVEDIKAALF